MENHGTNVNSEKQILVKVNSIYPPIIFSDSPIWWRKNEIEKLAKDED